MRDLISTFGALSQLARPNSLGLETSLPLHWTHTLSPVTLGSVTQRYTNINGGWDSEHPPSHTHCDIQNSKGSLLSPEWCHAPHTLGNSKLFHALHRMWHHIQSLWLEQSCVNVSLPTSNMAEGRPAIYLSILHWRASLVLVKPTSCLSQQVKQ